MNNVTREPLSARCLEMYVTHVIAGSSIDLTHWGRVTHICVGNLIIIVSDNGCRLVGAEPLSEPILEYY